METRVAKKKGYQEGIQKIAGGIRSLEASWTNEDYGISPTKECWKTEDLCPEKTETCSVNTKPCTKKTFSAVGCGNGEVDGGS